MTAKRRLIEVRVVANVYVDVAILCGDFTTRIERVYGLTYNGQTVQFSDLWRNVSDVGWIFDDRQLVEFLGESHHVHSSIGNRSTSATLDRGDVLEGLLYQLSNSTSHISCETIGQGGEYVLFEMPIRLLPAFRRRLNKLVAKIKTIEFITTDPAGDE